VVLRIVETPLFRAAVDDLKVVAVEMKGMFAWVIVVEDD
jgi:hypothetical protein